jgi:hypothetical protein
VSDLDGKERCASESIVVLGKTPTLTITSPKDGQIFNASELRKWGEFYIVPVNFTATDDVGLTELWITVDNGIMSVNPIRELSGRKYSGSIPVYVGGRRKRTIETHTIELKVYDVEGQSSEATVTITICKNGECVKKEETTSTTLTLHKGWNLISTPISRAITLEELLTSCKLGKYRGSYIWHWDADKRKWETPNIIEPGKGYYVYALNDCTLTFSEEQTLPEKVIIKKGWNMIPGINMSSDKLKNLCPFKKYIWYWNPKLEKWEYPTFLEVGKAYWIYAEKDCEIELQEKTKTLATLSDVNTAIYYWNLHSEPEKLEGAIDVIEDLNPDMIWYSHWITGFPMPKNPEHAYQITKKCGFSNEIAKKFKEWVEKEHYSLEDVELQRKSVERKGILYCPTILGYPNFRIDFNFDPLTFECYSKEDISKMLLNFGKWGIINPKTGKLYTLEETQKFLRELGEKKGAWVPENWGVYDLSNEKVIEYHVNKAIALRNVGVKCVWYDLFFQMPAKLSKALHLGYKHPMIKDLYNGACEIIDRAKAQGLIVGTWINAFYFPYERVPNVDYVTASPTVEEILDLKPDYSRWYKFAELIKQKRPGIPLIIMFDFSQSDELPLAVFSQKLNSEQQSQFLRELDKLAKKLEKDTGIKVLVAYPVHGPGIGAHAQKLAWGKYELYDALAPEFDTYETIKELAHKS